MLYNQQITLPLEIQGSYHCRHSALHSFSLLDSHIKFSYQDVYIYPLLAHLCLLPFCTHTHTLWSSLLNLLALYLYVHVTTHHSWTLYPSCAQAVFGNFLRCKPCKILPHQICGVHLKPKVGWHTPQGFTQEKISWGVCPKHLLKTAWSLPWGQINLWRGLKLSPHQGPGPHATLPKHTIACLWQTPHPNLAAGWRPNWSVLQAPSWGPATQPMKPKIMFECYHYNIKSPQMTYQTL